ncbi:MULTISPECIES: hypothetical protein [Streptomyces]|uniref:Large membrane protein n=1 Tax=Streptomyces dengpaensis TaxID=2049881 RepID=A0ABM6SX23_9ACTN|nr:MULTISPECIES: hypothetical protein [Streptomyces]AVH59174.1 hypothetical protein C4B68_29385 [Streptomyces dengpaensis]PIB08670.1 hypothetical protein B1C81_13980 [Streptomyces sp. HG99]
MSTERPDNDATDPSEGPAEGAEGPEGPSEGGVGPDERGVGSDERGVGPKERAEGPAEGAQSPAEGAQSPAEGTQGPAGNAEPVTSRRRHSPAVVASVAAAVLLVGGGGAYIAATVSGGSGNDRSSAPGGTGTPPPLALEGYGGEGGTSGTDGATGTNGIAPGEPNPYGATYRADGKLPGGPDAAPVYGAKGEVTKADAARLAKALGLKGTPTPAGDSWTVGSTKDGSQPHLRVNRNAPGTWTFSSYLPGADNCPKGKLCNPVGSSGLARMRPAAVSEEEARKAAAPVLKAIGQDDAKLDASQLMNDDRVRVVNADPVIGGLPTYGWTTGLQVDSEGKVFSGSGRLKTPVKGDTYPVIGAQKTLDLMNNRSASDGGGTGVGGCASPVPLTDGSEMPCELATAPPKPQSLTVEKATFGLATHLADGRQTLVPSWLFDVQTPGTDDSFTVTHPAVDPRYLATPAPPGDPSAQPSPSPTAPGDEPTSAPSTRDVTVQGYTVDGKDLTVSFTGGVCADYSASASETSDKVTVTVTEKPWKDKVCILIAMVYEKTVHLDQPLGDREVVGSDGRKIPEGKLPGPESVQPR